METEYGPGRTIPHPAMFRVLDALLSIDPATYRSIVRNYADELYNRYWTTSGVGGYRSGVSSGATRFYDDNGHVAVALAQAYHLTGDPVYLARNDFYLGYTRDRSPGITFTDVKDRHADAA